MASTVRPKVLVVLICLIALSVPNASAQDPTLRLAAIQRTFQDLTKDLVDFAQAATRTGQDRDYQAAYELFGIAQRSMDRATLAYRLVGIHGFVCEVDRAKLRPIVVFELDMMNKEIDIDLEATNFYVSTTQNQAIVQRGGDLRAELRALQGLVRKFPAQ